MTARLAGYVPVILFFFIASSVHAGAQTQAKHTVSGHVYDRSSSETLIGASVLDRLSLKGAASNSYGFYSLSLAEGEVDLRASYVGYGAATRQFVLRRDTVINLYLDASNELAEVVVEGQHGGMSGVTDATPGAIRVMPAAIRAVPAILGEADLIKMLQQTPGVSAGVEGFSGMYVRGGNRDENLYLIDGNPVYDVNHLFGFFSTFNPDAVKSAEFYKGSFPARFGGRLSSVVNVRTKDGDMQEYHGTFTVGLVSSKIQLEGPVVRDRASFSVAFRRTYLDLLTTPALWIANSKMEDEKDRFGYYFYDLNAKVNYRFSDRSRMYVNWYSGRDAFYGEQQFDSHPADGTEAAPDRFRRSENGTRWTWGNTLASVNLNHVFSPRLFGNLSVVYSRFRSDIGMYEQSEEKLNGILADRSRTEINHNSGIHDAGYRMDFDWTPHPNHVVRAGSNYLFHTFSPEEKRTSAATGRADGKGEGDTARFHSERIRAHELAFYVEDDMDVTAALKVNAGVHFSLFDVEGRTYGSLQPRLSARYLIRPKWSVKASYAMMTQYVHLLSLSTISLPNDLWVPVTQRIPPMRSKQFSAGVYHSPDRTWHFSLEAWYKEMHNLIEYRDGASMFTLSSSWQERVATGRGAARGVELLAHKAEGRLTGWAGYGLSRADRVFPDGEVNGGRRFPAKYDSRHKINVAADFKLSDRVDVNGSWTYYSGGLMTVGLESYAYAPVPGAASVTPDAVPAPAAPAPQPGIRYYDSRNNYRMSDYHRLDLGVNIRRPRKNGHAGVWNISVYNVYARRNPILAYPVTGESGRTAIEEITFLSFIPSISYTYTF